jgi:hypothetical protein
VLINTVISFSRAKRYKCNGLRENHNATLHSQAIRKLTYSIKDITTIHVHESCSSYYLFESDRFMRHPYHAILFYSRTGALRMSANPCYDMYPSPLRRPTQPERDTASANFIISRERYDLDNEIVGQGLCGT